jgi:hypothetical protein
MLTRTGTLYQENSSPQADRPTITGRDIAHGKRTVAERALGAADNHLGRIAVVEPTIGQAADLWRVCRPYVAAAVRIADDDAARAAVLAGETPILDVAKAANTETLAQHFARTTPAEWLEAARVIGPANVWDHMIAPLV